MPSVMVDGTVTPILHVSQLAAALGLEPPAPPTASTVALETVSVLESWLELVRPLDLETLTAPTASRGRSVRNLTVNVFHPFELLPRAWDASSFPWDPERDDERELALVTAGDVHTYAEGALASWSRFVRRLGADLDARDPVVRSPRGDVRFSALLDGQLRHAIFHREQLVAFLLDRGLDT